MERRLVRRILVLALLCALPAVACGPIVMIPGGALDGTPASPASDWSFSDSVDTIQLETRPADPYSVNLWGVGLGESFYVAAGEGSESTWAKNILTDPEVRLKISDDLYDLRATRVEDPEEIDRVLVALQKKYDFEPEPEQRAKAWLFRLDAR